MKNSAISNVKLGAFVLAGLLFLVLLLYMIGMNRNLFGANFTLKARFTNVQGLVEGNNVRFAGIETGTVKRIKILEDTVIEVTMIIDKKMMGVIRKDAVASISTEGFVGNKVVNIVPSGQAGQPAQHGDILATRKAVDTDEMLQTLQETNEDIGAIARALKATVQRINSSSALWDLLNDQSLPQNIRAAAFHIRSTTAKASEITGDLYDIVEGIKTGKGSAGAILTDSSLAKNLGEAILKIKNAGEQADLVATEINKLVADVRLDINNGKGALHALLNDSSIVTKVNTSLENIQKGTENFNQNMEALKHNFLLRGYFRKLERQKQ